MRMQGSWRWVGVHTPELYRVLVHARLLDNPWLLHPVTFLDQDSLSDLRPGHAERHPVSCNSTAEFYKIWEASIIRWGSFMESFTYSMYIRSCGSNYGDRKYLTLSKVTCVGRLRNIKRWRIVEYTQIRWWYDLCSECQHIELTRYTWCMTREVTLRCARTHGLFYTLHKYYMMNKVFWSIQEMTGGVNLRVLAYG